MNKPLSILAILAGAWIFGTCAEEPEPQLLLRTNARRNYGSDDYWIFISDEQGRLLGYKQLTVGDSLIEFYGHTRGTISLTTFNYNQYQSGGMAYDQYGIMTMQGIPAGSEFITGPTFSGTEYPPIVGKAAFTLTNYSDSDNPFNALTIEDGLQNWNSLLDWNTTMYQGTTFTTNFRLRAASSNVLAVAYHDGIPVHKWFNDVNVDDAINVDFSSFELSKTISINKPVNDGYVYGLQSDNRTYALSRLSNWKYSKSSNLNDNPKLGYIDGFDQYDIFVGLKPVICCEPTSNVVYYKRGSVPQSVAIPDYNMQVINKSIHSFSFEFDRPYQRKELFFKVSRPSVSGTWAFMVGREDLVVPHFPIQILESHPAFSTNDLTIDALNIIEDFSGFSNLDHIGNLLRGTPRSSWEYFDYYMWEIE